MSRIGKNPVSLPDGVTASVVGQTVKVNGPRGELSFTAPNEVSVEQVDGKLAVSPRGNSKRTRQMWGMSRTMVANCVSGVVKGFSKTLQISGVGYRAQVSGNLLKLSLGYSHEVDFAIPEGIVITTPSNTRIVIEGIDKQKVGQAAANIRRWRPPEPFKGKGIRYSDEYVFRKVGKKK